MDWLELRYRYDHMYLPLEYYSKDDSPEQTFRIFTRHYICKLFKSPKLNSNTIFIFLPLCLYCTYTNPKHMTGWSDILLVSGSMETHCYNAFHLPNNIYAVTKKKFLDWQKQVRVWQLYTSLQSKQLYFQIQTLLPIVLLPFF
jgi:hypothetical protein